MMRQPDTRIDEYSGRWWVLHTKPRQEKALARDLCHRGLDYFLPLTTATRRCGRRWARRLLPLFPGYLFCTCSTEEDRAEVLKTNRIARMLDVRDQICLKDELEQLRRVLTAGKQLDIFPSIKKGRCCRVIAGSLAGLEGIVTTRRNNGRVFLSVTTLGQSAIVDIDIGSLELID